MSWSRWCKRRKWDTSRLLLSLPQASSKSPQVFTYSGTLTQRPVCRWLLETLHLNLWKITNTRQLHENWLTFRSPLQQPETHVVVLTNKTSPPPFFSALSAQFPDTVKFAWGDTRSRGLADWTQELDIKTDMSPQVVLVANSAGVYVYGQVPSQCCTYACLKTFLNHFCPSQNFAVNASVIVATLLAVLEVFVYKKRLIKRVLTNLMIYYIVAVVMWLVVSSNDTFFVIRLVNTEVVQATRFIATTSIGAMIRDDVLLFSRHLFLFPLSLLPSIVVLKVLAYKLIGDLPDEEEDEALEEDNTNNPPGPVGVSAESLRRTNSNHEADREWRAQSDQRQHDPPQQSIARLVIERDGVTYQVLTAEDADHQLRFTLVVTVSESQSTANPRVTSELPEWSFSEESPLPFPDDFIQCEKCVICLEDFSEGDSLTGLPCKHVFHHPCLVHWLNGGSSHACPLCRG